jgi:hypothetical protein
VREAGAALGLVLRTDAVIGRDADDRRLAIGVDDDRQAIRESEALVGNVDGGDERRGGAGWADIGGTAALEARPWRSTVLTAQAESESARSEVVRKRRIAVLRFGDRGAFVTISNPSSP